MNPNGPFFGQSGGSLAAIASSGRPAAAGAPSCGSAGAGRSPFVCGQPLHVLPTVDDQPYVPGVFDMSTAPNCPVPR